MPETHPAEIVYGDAFFAGIDEGARRSAEIVVPLLVELFAPRSVVDVGGGGGCWGAAFLDQGTPDVLTIDGPWVPAAARVVPPDHFLEHDLREPLRLERTFDLALCLEAAEHLPASAASELVRALTEAAPVVVFSAALPGQGGDGHVNEQPPSYWASLFAGRGYVCFGDLRRRLWNTADVEVWYRQNLLCFVQGSMADHWRPRLAHVAEPADGGLDVAHPELLARHKRRGDELETYARRLEAEAVVSRRELADARSRLQQRQAQLDAVLQTRVWRGWRRILRTRERLRRLCARRGRSAGADDR